MAISVQRQEQQKLQGTDHGADAARSHALLTGVAKAAQRLLSIADFDAAVNEALAEIAQAAEIDRIYILENCLETETNRQSASMVYEWVTSAPLRVLGSGGLTVYREDFEEQCAMNERGQPYQILARDLSEPARTIQNRYEAVSLLTVPIMCGEGWWGVIGFDDCTAERVWSSAEISVLETAAANFAAALQRREASVALKRRDALLNSVNAAAQCLVVTDELAVAIPEALRILGEGTQQDRVYVFENVYPNGPDEVFWNLPYEWTNHAVPATSEIAADNFPLAMASFPSEIATPLLDWQATQFLTRDLEGRAKSLNDETQVLSLIAVPISVSGQWWGILGFDDCTTERVWSEAEVAVLETAAACIGSAIERDRTQKEKAAAAQARATELAERDRILEATATAANVMLTDDDFENAVSKALQIVGEGLTVDRVNLVQYFKEEDKVGYHRALPNEWASSNIPIQAEHPELVEISDEGVEFVVETLHKGEIFGGIVEELPEPFRSGQKELGVKSTYAIPILLDGNYWGAIGIDDCHHLTRRSESELEALTTLANCISNAIEKDRTRKEKEAAAKARVAELAERDRILEATAAAANVMLTDEDFDSAVNKALRIAGEGLAVDRVLLMQYFNAIAPQAAGYSQVVYEWSAENIPSQIEHPDLAVVSDEGIEFIILDILRQGHTFGGIVEELPEPFRSGQLELGVQSTYAVPILVENAFWGLIAFDDCHNQTRRSESELEALMTLANCIGSAIEREHNKKEREETAITRATELAERDRILEATAAAANVMLTDDDFDTAVNKALAIVGEGLAVDRIALGKYFEAASFSEISYHHFL